MTKHFTIQTWLKTNHPEVYLTWKNQQKEIRAQRTKDRYLEMKAALEKVRKQKVVHK